MKREEIKTSKFTKTATLTFRVSSRTKYLLELLGRKQHRTISSVLEHSIYMAIENELKGIIEKTWDVDRDQRLGRLHKYYPELLSQDELDEIKLKITDKMPQ